jgi:hypothetical protein
MTDVLGAAGFWSYVRTDDDAESGRITALANEVKRQYALYTASELQIFLDRADLKWGDDWRSEIDAALEAVTFFIPIVTPGFFASTECRRELLEFMRRAEAKQLEGLILPIYYVELPAGLTRDSDDELVSGVATRHYEDWRALRLEDPTSSAHRQGVDRLVSRLVQITQEVTQTPPSSPPEPITRSEIRSVLSTAGRSDEQEGETAEEDDDDSEGDGEPGLIDLIALAEEAMPRWNAQIVRLGELLNISSDLAEEAAREMERSDERGKGFAGRVHQAQLFANKLAAPADEMAEIANDYWPTVRDVDRGLRALLDLADHASPEEQAAVDELYETVRELAAQSQTAAEQYASLAATLHESTKLSRALRPPLRKMAQALNELTDAQTLIDSWLARIDGHDN